MRCPCTALIDRISIHASTQEATERAYRLAERYSKFQSTPPRRRRRILLGVWNDTQQFQSTPPRRRRRRYGGYVRLNASISIHASTQEATAVLAKYKPAFLAKINNFFLFCCTLSTQKRHAFPSFLIFVQLDQCESLRGFLSTLDSHWSLFALRNISQAYVLLRFCKTAIHRINVSSAEIPLSTPICSTLVWYLFPR